jgi:hypothetical protein
MSPPRAGGTIEPAVSAALSPELVLVSPPEVAAEARRDLPPPRPLTYRPPERITQRAVLLFYLSCLAGTVGPLVLASLTR